MWVPVLLNSVCKYVCCTHVEMCAYLLNVYMRACVPYLYMFLACIYLNVYVLICILSLYKYSHVSVPVCHADIV
jgi:hypothetical protein